MRCSDGIDNLIANEGKFGHLTACTLTAEDIVCSPESPLKIVTGTCNTTIATVDPVSLDIYGHVDLVGLHLVPCVNNPSTQAATLWLDEKKDLYFGTVNLTETLVGPPGRDACDGPDGPQGPVGPQGLAGPSGGTGYTGDTGFSGPAGVNGLPGIDGKNGLNGTDGIDGPAGPVGPSGRVGPLDPAILLHQFGGSSLAYNSGAPLDLLALNNVTMLLGQSIQIDYLASVQVTGLPVVIACTVKLGANIIAQFSPTVRDLTSIHINCTFGSASALYAQTFANIFTEMSLVTNELSHSTYWAANDEAKILAKDIIDQPLTLSITSTSNITIVPIRAHVVSYPMRQRRLLFSRNETNVQLPIDQTSEDDFGTYRLNCVTLPVGRSLRIEFEATILSTATFECFLLLDTMSFVTIPFVNANGFMRFSVFVTNNNGDLYCDGSTTYSKFEQDKQQFTLLTPQITTIADPRNAILKLISIPNPNIEKYSFHVLYY